MRLRIRLCGMQDIDLIMLKENRSFSLEGAIYTALAAYVRGEDIRIDVPQSAGPDLNTLTRYVYVKLDDEKDADIIQMCRGIIKGARTMAVKSILRNYLAKPNISMLMDAGFADMIRETKKREQQKQSLPDQGAQKTQTEHDEQQLRQTMPEPIEAETQDTVQANNDEVWDIFSDDGFVANY